MDWVRSVSDGFNAVTMNRWIGLVCGFTGFRPEGDIATSGSGWRRTIIQVTTLNGIVNV
jgi:hypothetical protein